jgi:hypothetical protein
MLVFVIGPDGETQQQRRQTSETCFPETCLVLFRVSINL